jgi:hypothetical protein
MAMQINFKISCKNLTSWRDLNPRSSHPVAETMTTTPRRRQREEELFLKAKLILIVPQYFMGNSQFLWVKKVLTSSK